jgi:hypothetical protein
MTEFNFLYEDDGVNLLYPPKICFGFGGLRLLWIWNRFMCYDSYQDSFFFCNYSLDEYYETFSVS